MLEMYAPLLWDEDLLLRERRATFALTLCSKKNEEKEERRITPEYKAKGYDQHLTKTDKGPGRKTISLKETNLPSLKPPSY